MGFSPETLRINNITLANISAADFIFDTVTNGVVIAGSNNSNTLFGSLGDDVINAAIQMMVLMAVTAMIYLRAVPAVTL